MWFYRLVNFLARIVFFSVYPRKIIGRENMPGDGGVLVLCNHLRFHDIFNITTCFNRRVTFMAKRELYENKFWGYLFRKYGSFPVERGESDMSAIKTAITLLKNGGVLAVFPEGTRYNQGAALGELKEGSALIAAKAQAHILPMFISRAQSLFKPMHVVIGKPFKLPEGERIDSDYLKRCTERIRGEMLKLRVYNAKTGAMGKYS